MDIERINRVIRESGNIKKLVYFDTLGSTNEYAKNNSLEDDTLVLCDYQKRGKGRFNRSWEGRKGEGLTFTIVKNLSVPVDDIAVVNFYTTYILFKVLKDFLAYESVQITLKWPNDIVLNGKKVSGILIEIRDINKEIKKFIIGIGLNVNQTGFSEEIADKATSLYLETGKQILREELLLRIIESFYGNIVLISDKEKLFSLWKENFDLINKEITIRKFIDDDEVPAIIRDLGPDGGLTVEMEDGSRSKYYSGEISLPYNN